MRGSSVVLDASVLIEIVLGKEEIINKVLERYDVLYTNRVSLVETYYIICRALGAEEAEKRVRILEESLFVVEVSEVWRGVGKCKCKFPVSIGDCFTLATSKLLKATALFLKPEKELVKILNSLKKEYDIAFVFEL